MFNLRLLKELYNNPQQTQRDLAQRLDVAVGKVNQAVQEIRKDGYITEDSYQVTPEGIKALKPHKVDNAVILAAGFGSRFVPMTYRTPKGLIPVHGQPMLERQIQQLHDKDITDIVLVVGYLKEKFDYLVDKYGVQLIYNPEYNTKNNLASLYLAIPHLKNTYILSADNWMSENIFSKYEPVSLYSSVYDKGETEEWCLTYDSNKKITSVTIGGQDSWVMYGPVYFTKKFSDKLIPMIEERYYQSGTENDLWEHILIDKIKELELYLAPYPDNVVYEFESFEELREFDPNYRNESKDKALETIAKVFGITEREISDIHPIKAGMTNQSFVFKANGKDYVFRLPGVGTEALINRKQEYKSYQATNDLSFRENVIYFDDETGMKISTYYNGCRNANKDLPKDVEKCMSLARKLHKEEIIVAHHFDLENEMKRYIELCKQEGAIRYRDFESVYEDMKALLYIKKQIPYKAILSHIDCIPDNVLICPDGTAILIDWEYSGMADPLIDIAMFAIYSYYEPEQVNELIEIYFQRKPTVEERLRVYLHIALSGFLWAMWTEYKQALGIEFGEYGMKMYRYAKDYYVISQNIWRNMNEN